MNNDKHITNEQTQKEFVLTISKGSDGLTSVNSTDEGFDLNNLSLGDNYKPLDVVFKKKSNGEGISRILNKGEKRISNQTLPRLACQVFENKIAEMSEEDKKGFPVCQYNPSSEMLCGIYPSVDEYRSYRNSIEYCIYSRGNGHQFVFYCWNIFSTVIFVRECLERFGESGDQMSLTYTYKRKKDKQKAPNSCESGSVQDEDPLLDLLTQNKQLILTGAPGTGKTYTAKELAMKIVGEGKKENIYTVQFHPSYDYSDFIVGLKPNLLPATGKPQSDSEKNQISFNWEDGIFKRLCDKAKGEPGDDFVMIIDEINRADISRVFGEAFSCLEEDYRGEQIKLPSGGWFTIPKNVYIIGTMNDIDRSVESMDFALRRRFAWREISAKESQKMLKDERWRKEACSRMDCVNARLEQCLGREYCLGAAYFKKLEKYKEDFEKLWDNHIEIILNEYLRGHPNAKTILEALKSDYSKKDEHTKDPEAEG